MQIIQYINTNVKLKENAITKISQLATKIILNLLENNKKMVSFFPKLLFLTHR